MIDNPSFSNTQQVSSPTDLALQRNRMARAIMIATAVIFFIAGTSIFFVAPQDSDSKYSTLALGLNLIAATIVYLSFAGGSENHNNVMWYFFLTHIAFLAIGLLVSESNLVVALISLIYSFLISSVFLNGNDSEIGVTIGITNAFLILLGNLFLVEFQIKIPGYALFLPPLVGILIIAYIAMIVLGFVTVPLRIKLIVASLFMVIIPLIVLSLVTTTTVHINFSEQRLQNMQLAAQRTATVIDEFLNTNKLAVEDESDTKILGQYLAATDLERKTLRGEIELLFNTLSQRGSEYIRSFGLLDNTGTNIFDTDSAQVNKVEGFSDYFLEAFTKQKSFISDIRFEDNRRSSFFISSPIKDDASNTLGVFRVKFNSEAFQTLLEGQKDLAGPKTRPILLDENQIRLADAYNRTYIFNTLAPINPSQLTQLKSTGKLPNIQDALLSTNMIELANQLKKNAGKNKVYSAQMISLDTESRNDEVLIAAQMNAKPWTILYTQSASALQNLVQQQTSLAWLVTTIIGFLTTMAATFVARSISSPIIRLTDTAKEIAAGKIDAKAEISTSDEVGTLAGIFNNMTAQLRHLISSLEDRVAARTQQLDEQNKSLMLRSRQIETIAEVAKQLTSTQDLENLLTLVTILVSQRFGFYHAGVFLLDENNEYAVLRAANSEGGKRMLARQHKLKIGQVGIVGYVTGQGEARIATDVGEDASYFNNPDLPLTRSEMSLPLIAESKVIGALDIQSEQSNAFTQQDIEVFTTLADQVAVGIMNSRLLDETQRALNEAQAVHKQYLNQEWAKEVTEQSVIGYRHTPAGLQPLTQTMKNEPVRKSKPLHTGSLILVSDQVEKTTMKVPILLKGEVIGEIQLQDANRSNREWSETEVSAAQAVADQIAQALENARLFEQTVRRAERERKVLEITSKIRATNDPQAMMEIALQEVKQALGASRAQVIMKSDWTHTDTEQSEASTGLVTK